MHLRSDAYVGYAQMNRPFGAVDVAANLKGAVPKTATQKILVALAEKGELVQKTYGAYPQSCMRKKWSDGVVH